MVAALKRYLCAKAVPALLLSLLATGGLVLADLPEGIEFGPWIVAPSFEMSYEADSNVFLDNEQAEEDDRVTERLLASQPTAKEPAFLSQRLLEVLERAERDSQKRASNLVTAGDLLNALCQELRGPVAEVLSTFSLGPGSLSAV